MRYHTKGKASAVIAAGMLTTTLSACSLLNTDGTSETTSSPSGSASNSDNQPTQNPITEAQSHSVFELNVGDCLVLDQAPEDNAENLPAIDCSQPHDGEIYAEREMTENSYPGNQAAQTQTKQFCRDKFEPFVGLSLEQSALNVTYLYPTQESWDQQDDRIIQCIIVDQAGGVSGSLRNSKR